MFLKRLVDHLLNQVLVEGLANSRWFQKFAVWSHGAMKEIQAKSKDVKVEEHITTFYEAAKQKSSQFRAELEQEMKKLQEQQQQQAGKR